MPLSPTERKLRASLAAHESWAQTDDRTERTSHARRAFADSFLQKVDPDGKLPEEERRRRAENARKAYYRRLALQSAKNRRRRKELDDDQADLEAQAAEAGVALDSLEDAS